MQIFSPGICAGFLWTAHGSLVLAYLTESSKGRYIAICWSVFNLGAVIGACVALGQNIHSRANSVGAGTYIAFLILTLIGAMLPLLMADPKKVGHSPLLVPSPVSQCKVTWWFLVQTRFTARMEHRNPSWKTEFLGQYLTLKNDPMIVIL